MSPFEAMKKLSPEKRHFVYGVNCFQYALGFLTPVVARREQGDALCLLYVLPSPGRLTRADVAAVGDEGRFQTLMVAKCQAEGLLDCGRKPVRQKGFRTLALYVRTTKNGFDFHFTYQARQNLWVGKFPFQHPFAAPTPEAGGFGYRVVRFFLSPKGLVPQSVRALATVERTVGKGTQQARLLEVVNAARPDLTGTLLFCNLRTGTARIETLKLDVPMPAWPPQGEPKRPFSPRDMLPIVSPPSYC
jgi:hypothetical protein